MDASNGKIINLELAKVLAENVEQYTQPIDPANLTPKFRAELEATGRTQISRNSPCPCGSRKRFKRCCMTKAAP